MCLEPIPTSFDSRPLTFCARVAYFYVHFLRYAVQHLFVLQQQQSVVSY
jgi:hypothetical protein